MAKRTPPQQGRPAKQTAAFMRTDDFKRQMGEPAIASQRLALGTSAERLFYQFEPGHLVAPATLEKSIPVKLDQARKTFTTIRAVIRYDGKSFAIFSGGSLIGVLSRHPTHTPTIALEYRRIAEEREQVASRATIDEQLDKILARLDKILALLEG